MADTLAPLPQELPATFLPALLELLPNGVAYYTPVYEAAGSIIDFQLTYLNPAAQRMLKLPAQPTATFAELWPSSIDNNTLAFLRDTFLAGKPAELKQFFQTDGYDIYFQAHINRLETGLLLTFADTTEQPRTTVEVALRNSQVREAAARAEAERDRENLLRVFEQVTVAIAFFRGPDHIIELANAEMANIWGRTAAQTLGRPVFEALPDIKGQGFEAIFADVLRHGTPHDIQEIPVTIARAHTDRPTRGYFNLTYRPQHDAEGHIIGIITLAIEITEEVLARRRVQTLNEELTTLNEALQTTNADYLRTNAALADAQQELLRLNAELEARVFERTRELRHAQANTEHQRQRLENFIMQAPALLCVFDGPHFVFELVNPLYQQLFMGRRLLGLPLAEALPDLADPGTWALLKEVYRTGQPFVATEQLVPINRTLGGPTEERYFNLMYQARRDDTEKVDGLLIFATDVTEQVLARQATEHIAQQLEAGRAHVQKLNDELAAINKELVNSNQELGATNQQLTRTNLDLDNFVYTASHDLRAPISNIEGLLQLLNVLLPNSLRTSAEVAPVLVRMHESIERFTRTIALLTDISKLQAEFAQPATPIALRPMVEDVQRDLQPLLAQTGGHLAIDLADCPLLVFSEKNLRSVVYNLLSNAFKYHHPERPPQVRLSCAREDHWLRLRVQDNGLGLTAAQQVKLFGLFQRLHTHVEGSGVGLYMVRKMVENGGGTIAVESEANVGTTFTVSFPV
jgi:signal transduction histidine kinase/PAS domain-containing protein